MVARLGYLIPGSATDVVTEEKAGKDGYLLPGEVHPEMKAGKGAVLTAHRPEDGGGIAGTLVFLMRGVDVDCGSPTIRTWRVVDVPDFTGGQYTGPRCGVTPLSDITVQARWKE